MKTFEIYEHPNGKTKVIKKGWSWPGFLFGGIWALFKKLWILGSCLLSLELILMLMQLGLSNENDPNALIAAMYIGAFNTGLSLGLSAMFGVSGNSMVIRNLTKKGFRRINLLSADNGTMALAMHIQSQPR